MLETEKHLAYIFDVDGTLANTDPYLHYIKNVDDEPEFKKNYDKFHGESMNAVPHKEVVDMLKKAYEAGYHILVVTARRESWRAHTSLWMTLNGIPHHALFMRKLDDYRTDYEAKKDILDQINEHWHVVHAVDDNPHIIRLWEENNIPTTKIGTWDGTR